MSRLPTPPVLQRSLQNPRTLAGAYKLADGMMAGNFGLDVALGEADIDQGRMAARIVYADGNRRDGVGDLLEVSGIQLWRHRANPIGLLDHGKQIALPIGTCEDPETKAYRNEIDPLAKTAAAWCFFYGGKGLSGVQAAAEYDHALLCEQLFDMVVKRILRGGSIGYQNIKTLPLQADYQTGTPPGQHLLVTLMLEFSLVVLPANGDTVMKGFATPDAYNAWEESVRRNLSRGYLVCGKALSPVLHKSLAAYVPAETKTVSGYEGKSYSIARKLQEAGERLAQSESPAPMPGYGQIFLNSDRVWYVGGDGDEDGFADLVQQTLSGIDGIEEVICEAEGFPPKGEGWQQVYPKQRAWEKSMPAKEVAVPLANIPDTKIPPAKFNPGVGAVCGCDKKKLKALRGKYGRGKSLDEAEAAAKISAQESKLPHVQQGMMVCPKCGKRYYTEEKAMACCGSNEAHRLRGKYMGADQEQTATDTRCGQDGVKYRVGQKAQPFHFGKGWTAVARKSLGVKGYELRRVRRDRDGLEGWIVFNTGTGRPDSDEIYWNESDARRHLADAMEAERMGGGYDDPDPGRGVRRKGIEIQVTDSRFSSRQSDMERAVRNGGYPSGVITWSREAGLYARPDMGWAEDDEIQIATFVNRKSIQVKYRNKLVKGVPNVSMKFDTSGMSTEQQNAFVKAMQEAGFGKPKGLGGRWSDGEKTQLTSPMKAAAFAFDMDPATANIPDAVGKAVAIASQHGAKFLGSQKSTNPPRTKSAEYDQANARMTAAGAEYRRVQQAYRNRTIGDEEYLAARKVYEAAQREYDAAYAREEAAGGKSTQVQGTKAMKTRKKAMPGTDVDAMADDLAGADAVAVATDEMAGVEGDVLAAEEKMGAQVLRRLHEIHSALLEEGDEMLELLENEQVRALLESKLQDVADTITECEELFSGEGYGSLNGELEDKSADGVDADEEPTDSDGNLEEALPDDSSPDEEEPAEDAVAGMAMKQLRAKYLKALRKHYGKKQPVTQTKALTEDEAAAIADDIEAQTEGTEKALEPWEKKAVGAAAGYLKGLGELAEPWGDGHRKDAYFHHKTLEPIGSQMEDPTKVDAIGQGVEMATDGGGAVKEMATEPQRRAAMARMRENDELDDYDDDKGLRCKGICPGCGSEPCTCAEAPAAMETKLCGRKAVGAASQFLKELSETQEFNDDFRTKSMGWHKDLAEMAADEAAADAVDSGLPPDGEVEMKEISGEPQRRAAMARMRENDELDDYDDDKGLKAKSLKAAAQQDRQALEEAARKLDRLAQLFG